MFHLLVLFFQICLAIILTMKLLDLRYNIAPFKWLPTSTRLSGWLREVRKWREPNISNFLLLLAILVELRPLAAAVVVVVVVVVVFVILVRLRP